MRRGNICHWENKRPLITSVSSQQEHRWLSWIRLKAQRAVMAVIILEDEANQFEIRKQLATTDGYNIKHAQILNCLSLDCAYS